MKKQDTEIKNTKQIIELLKMYILAQTNDEKSWCIAEIQKLNPDVPALLQKYTANELQTRLKHAIYKDNFRPKNISIVSFAADEDMEYINGEFSTFDIKLSKAAKKYNQSNRYSKTITTRRKTTEHDVKTVYTRLDKNIIKIQKHYS